MGIVVFDADVLIGYLERTDVHHAEAVARVRRAIEAGTQRLLSAVNYSEVLVRPLQERGAGGGTVVDAMLSSLRIETIPVDGRLAFQAAQVRARTKLALPDAFAIATALNAARRGHASVGLESFDRRVLKAFGALQPS